MAMFRDKDGSLDIEAVSFVIIGGWCVRKGLPNFDPFLKEARQIAPWYLICGSVLLAVGFGKGLQKRWAEWLELVFFTALLGCLSFELATGSWTALRMGAIFAVGWLAWRKWLTLQAAEAKPDAENEEKPLISLVLLLSKPRYLEEKVLAHIVEFAWGGNYADEDEEKRDGFVVSAGWINLIQSPMGMFAVHNFPAPYWKDPDAAAAKLPDLRLRKLVQAHQAWLSVDLMSSSDTDPGHAAAYAVIVRLLNELADETVLAILRPETGIISEWSEEVQNELLRPHGEDKFYEAGNVPVIALEADDPEMRTVVEEARRRWPEFVAAYGGRAPDDRFAIKAAITVADRTEHIWVEVDGLEPGFVHGTLANDPVDLGALKLGSRVEVPEANVEDWVYILGEADPVGLFTPAVVRKRQQQFSPSENQP